MARQVLPWVGMAVGAMFGMPQVGFMIGSIVGNAVDPQVIKGPKLGEAGLQTSAEGVFRPIVFGTAAIKGNVISRGNRKVKTKRTQQSKGGGPVTEEQRVYWTFAIRLTGHEIKGVSRIWQDEKLVYDVRPGSTIAAESAAFAERFRLYLGDEEQLPDPDIEAYMGIGNAPAYRGSSYIVFPNFDLTDRRESIPDFRFEVMGDGGIFAWDYTWDFTAIPAIGGTQNSKPAFSEASGVCVFTSNQGAFVTTDGPTWSHEDTRAMISVCHSPQLGLFVASRSDGSEIRTSATGYAPWVERYADASSGGGQVCWAADIPEFLSLPDNTQLTKACLHSADGETWTRHLLPAGGPINVSRVIRSERLGLYIAVCDRTPAATERIWTSTTGRNGTWVAHGAYDVDWYDVIDVPELGLVIMIGEPGGGSNAIILTTTDFTTLTDSTPPGFTSIPIGATYIPDSGEVVVTTWDAVNFLTSTDGLNYTFHAAGLPPSAYHAPQWCGGAINKIVSVSTGGISGDGVSLTQSAIENGTTLGQIVTFLHQIAGHTSSEYEVSELTDRVFGLALAGDYDCSGAIRTLMPSYFFDASEYDGGSGYRIHYHKRGKPVVKTITVDDLIEAPERSVREDALERPRVLHLHYESPTIGYAPAKATERRDSPDILVVGERSIQTPVAFEDPDEPAGISRKLMKVVWTEVAGEEHFTVHDGHLDLVPSDCIGVVLRNQVRRMRVVQQWVTLGDIRLSLIRDRQSAYTAEVTGIPLPPPTQPLPSLAGETIHEILDIPALNDTHDSLRYYTAGTGESGGWYGYLLQRKTESDLDFSDVQSITQRSIMGELVDGVAAAPEHYIDTTNVVRVQMHNDDILDSMTDAQFLSEGGAFALETASGWEVMQYRDADEESPGVFALSYLARGRLNTGGSAHSAGARFVLLDSVKSIDAVTAFINTTLTHRAVSLGASPDGVPTSTLTYTAKSQTEFPCAHLFGELDGDTLLLSTVPRHRFGTETMPVRSVNWIGYRWTATDGVNSATADGISDAQNFDVTGWATPITITVAQLNRFTGAGPTISESVS